MDMELYLQLLGVALVNLTALGGFGAWGLRRMDRRFDEAAEDRRRIETSLSGRIDSLDSRMVSLEGRVALLEGRLASLEARLDSLEDRLVSLEARLDSLEARLDSLEGRMGLLEIRLDGWAKQVSGDMAAVNRELGKLQGFTAAARVRRMAST